MSRRIFKYHFAEVDRQIIAIPHDHEILHLGMQYGQPTLWAIVDDNSDDANYVIWIVPTGDTLPTDGAAGRLSAEHHIGTIQKQLTTSVELVWHVFMRPA